RIQIPAARGIVPADLTIPASASYIVIFSHAGIDSPQNHLNEIVLDHLHEAGIGTLVPELLSVEEINCSKEFDIELMTSRLMAVTRWVLDRDLFGHYRVGYYAAGTGAASALVAAAGLGYAVGAIVCRGGRPDLASEALPEIQSPVLFIVGSQDKYVLELNRLAFDAISAEKKLSIVQDATHFFSDDKIGEVASLAGTWFEEHLGVRQAQPIKTGIR
ncbi:MAG TPA: alpha/beta hydrolase, partial [Puia sp.]|nr:alpha/beta hydrolase [Puia sp.]